MRRSGREKKLVACHDFGSVRRGRGAQLASLRATLASEFTQVDVVFADPDTASA